MLSAIINGAGHQFHSLADFSRAVDAGHDQDYREIWVEREEASMCALAAGDIAWLMMLRFTGDVGFSSRNPSVADDAGEMMCFRLSNGQVDEYPAAWALPKDVWVPAILHFAETGERSDLVHWHDEG